MHAVAQLHRSERQSKRVLRQLKRDRTKGITESLRLSYVHVRKTVFGTKELHKGGVTVCYVRPEKPGQRMFKVACAVVHDNDTYCKLDGRAAAASHMAAGQWMMVRVPKNSTISGFMNSMFWAMLDE